MELLTLPLLEERSKAARRARSRMVAADAPDEEIHAVVDDFRVKYSGE
jgi:hypothetical protein